MSATIGGTAVTFPTSNYFVGATGSTVLSLWDTVTGLKDPNTLPTIYKQYKGDGVLMRDYFRANGSIRSIPSQDMNIIEEVAEQRPIITGAITATSIAGAVFTIKLSPSCGVNPSGSIYKWPVQAFDKIEIPSTYLGGTTQSFEAQVLSVSQGTYAGDTLTCYFQSSAVYIASPIPSSVPLAVNANAFARGTGQPQGTNSYPVSHSHTTGICKATIVLQEDVLAQKNIPIEYNGNRWIINEMTGKLERRLERYVDSQIHRGNKNENTSVLVQTTTLDGDSGVIRSTDGLVPLMNRYSMVDTYDTAFKISNLNDVTEGFVSQQMFTTDVAVYCGQGFRNTVNDLIRDYGKNFSHTDMFNRVNNVLGITPSGLNYNDYTFMFQVLSTLSNPSAAGLKYNGEALYEYLNSAIFVPDSQITVKKFGNEVDVSIPNLGLGYVNYNGENSGKVFGVLKGMTNMENGNLGTDKAGVSYYWKEEFMLFGGLFNQLYYITKA